VPACLLLYLGVAAAWAWASFDDAVAAVAIPARAPLSDAQRRILLQVEDPAFYDHAGVSLAKGAGLATISTSVARILYLDGGDLGGVKGAFQSLYRAVFGCCKRVDLGRDTMGVVVNARLPKELQLAVYVARVYMGTQAGEEVRGLARAAQVYLGKPLEAATPDEFAGLAGMIKAPNLYHPLRDPAAYAQRKARIAALVAGTCRPAGWRDTALSACAGDQARRARSE
jgi:membrane carboxypeptidase/penicillin-binding protein